MTHKIYLAPIDLMRRRKFRGERGVGTWLDRIAQRKIADYWRWRAHADGLAPINLTARLQFG